MSQKYFVIGFRKIKTAAEYRNKVYGHNHRNRHYKNSHININWEKTKDNIILQELKYKNAQELIEHGNSNLKGKARKLKRGSSFCFEIVVDCTPDANWTEEDYIRYLKDAKEYFDKRFQGQECVSAVIHVDEGKPHLHVVYSYFNMELGKWNQRGLMEQKKTDLNKILSDFQKEVGAKYGLVRGEGKSLDKELIKQIKKEKAIKKQKIVTKKLLGIIPVSEEKVVLDVKKTKQAIQNLDKKYKLAITENSKLKNELIKTKRENQEIREKTEKLERKNLMLSKNLNKVRELEEENKELREKLIRVKDIANKLANELAETKAKLSKSDKTIAEKIIKEQINKKVRDLEV
jgi:hypothetical protein